MVRFIIAALFLSASPFLSVGQTAAPDRTSIWAGRGSFNLGKSVPGVIEVRGEKAFPILKDANGARVFAAAGHSGKGRLVAFAHGSFLLNTTFLQQTPAFELWKNSVIWASGNPAPIVGIHPSARRSAEMAIKAGFKIKILSPNQLGQSDTDAYFVISDSRDLKPADIQTLIQYNQKGKGLIVATTPWAFAKRHPDFSQAPGNQLLSKAGLYFLPKSYAANNRPITITQPIESIPIEERTWTQAGNTPQSNHPAVVAIRELIQNTDSPDPKMIAEMNRAKALGGEDIAAYLVELKKLNTALGNIIPTRKAPVIPGKQPLVDAVIELETYFNQTLPAGVMYPIPAGFDFPGPIPKDAERTSEKKVAIDATYRGWVPLRNAGGWNAKEILTTGTYAPPGEVITVKVPAAIAAKGYEVVIGSYGGGLQKRKAWHRYPKTQRSFGIKSTITLASNGFGGIIGIRIPHDAKLGKQEITISGAIDSPRYIHGETSIAHWLEQTRQSPAPVAELVSDRIIITVPSGDIRNLENPDAVMELWNQIIDLSAELAAIDRTNYRAERIVFDRQPSAGLLHSGYPVCGFTGVHSRLAVNAEKLKKEGFWGFFHEYGHNHQHALWGLPGTVETTCNLWSIYVYENLIGVPREKMHRAITPFNRLQTRKKYFNQGANFKANWNVWTAFDTYLLVQDEFGWEPFTKVFAEYNQLPKEEWPRTQQAINDQWVIRLSKACGKNLAPYWRTWNLPLSTNVDNALKDLPIWVCPEVAQWAKQ